MNAVPVTSCGQCPTCKTYVPIPPDLLDSLTAASHANSISNGLHTNRSPVSTNPIKEQYVPSSNSATVHPSIQPWVGKPDYPLSDYESSWRSKFWRLPVLIHSIVEIVLAVLIFILEIASLGISTYAATGAGIWCNIPFMIAAISTLMLVRKWDRSRLWATRVLIAQLILIVFSFILIGIVGNFVSSHSSVASLYSSLNTDTSIGGDSFLTKYRIMQAQLAFAILLLFAGTAYVVFYAVVTYLALWKPFKTLDTPHLFHE